MKKIIQLKKDLEALEALRLQMAKNPMNEKRYKRLKKFIQNYKVKK